MDFLTTATRIEAHLRQLDSFPRWTPEERFTFIKELADLSQETAGFRFRTNVADWSEVLRWWLQAPGARQPRSEEVQTWLRMATGDFEYRLGTAIGTVLSSIWNRVRGDALEVPNLEEWRAATGLPWSAIWIRELLAWGTLEPLVAYLMATNRAATRHEALARLPEYHAWLQARDGTLIEEDIYHPQRLREWAEELRPQRTPEAEFAAEIGAVAVGVFPPPSPAYPVVSLINEDQVSWLDPAGYVLAHSRQSDSVARIAAATGAPEPGEGRSLPSLAINQPFDVLCRAVGQCLRNAPLFRKGERLWTINAATGEELPINASVWRSWHRQFFTFHVGDGDKRRSANASRDLAQVILDSHELRAHVRELRGVNLLRLPVWRGEGADRKPDLLPEGYDAATRTFTVPLLDYATDWRLEDAHAWLDATFGSFPFYESGELFTRRSFAALVAAMVGVFTVNLLPDGAVRPMVLVDGNDVKLGKSLLVRMMLSFVHGKIAEGSKPKSDEELRKILDATAIAGKPYLFLDDLHSLASNDLNHFSTSPTHELRVMNTQNLPSCPNVWQVFGTGRDIKLDDNLERRVLAIDLFSSEDWRTRKVANPWTNPQVILPSYRSPACSAIWALLKNWIEAGMPKGATRLDSFEDWSEIVGNVVMAADIADPCGRRENMRGGNDALRALVAAVGALAAKCDNGEELTTGEILAQLENEGTLDVVVPFAKNELGQKQRLGWKLQSLRGNAYTDTRGRRFEFGRRGDAAGSKYTLHFSNDATG